MNPSEISFVELRTEARSIEDIAQWFDANRLCIPSIPEAFIPNLEITKPQSIFNLDFKNNDVLMLVNMHIRGALQVEVKPALSAEKFSEMTGQPVEVLRNIYDSATYATEFRLTLQAMDWPFVSCEAALRALTDGGIKSQQIKKYVQASWTKHFPQIQWDGLEAMHAGGLLPLESNAFKEWVFAQPRTQKHLVELPLEIS